MTDRYTIKTETACKIRPYVVQCPEGERAFASFSQAADFVACMEAIERDIVRLVRCHGLGLTMRATLETFGGST